MKNRDSEYIQRIITYCQKIEDILNGIDYDYEIFLSNEIYQLSVGMCIIQIGEYISRLSFEFKEEHKNIPWRSIKGLRNVTTHQYEHIELPVLWKTLVNRI